MRTMKLLLAFFACTAILALQFSGLHLHAGAPEHEPALHGSHVHADELAGHGHAHDAEVDVSVLDLGTASAKNTAFIVAPMTIRLPVATPALQFALPADSSPGQSPRLRWRPPLRAPPLTS